MDSKQEDKETVELRRYLVATRHRGRQMTLRRRRRSSLAQEPPWLRCAVMQMMTVVVCSSFLSLVIYAIAAQHKAKRYSYLPPRLKIADIKLMDIQYIDHPLLLRVVGAGEQNCDFSNTTWSMVIFVKSQITNFDRREMIRRTWASLSRLGSANFSTFFVVGQPSKSRLFDKDMEARTLLEEEKQRYGDILHFDGPDDYTNIGFKTLTGMRWAAENLLRDQFYATADDDFMLDLGELQNSVDLLLKNATNSDGFPLICGHDMFEDVAPFRDLGSKWYVSMEEYPNATYPKFCLGGMYAMRVDLARRLWHVARTRTPMRVDDVWVTGILRQEIGVPATQLVMPSKSISRHMDNFKRTRIRSRRSFMWKDWMRIYRRFANKTVCHRW